MIRAALSEFLSSPAGAALLAALVAAFADLATGVFAALRDGTFTLTALAAFLRKHILGRVAPLGTLLFLGYFGGPAGEIFLGFAIIGLTTYAAETAASITENFRPAKVNPVPTE